MVPAANAAAEHLLPEPEHIDLTDEAEDGTEKGAGTAVTHPDYELIDLSSEAATAEDEDLGGDNCPCGCHSRTPKERINQQQQLSLVLNPHCLHCSIKFVNGRLYLRDGRNLRPAMAEVARGGQTAEGDRARSARNSAKKGKKAAAEIVTS